MFDGIWKAAMIGMAGVLLGLVCAFIGFGIWIGIGIGERRTMRHLTEGGWRVSTNVVTNVTYSLNKEAK